MIETSRLILRPWKKNRADAKALYKYAKDPRVGPAAGWPVHVSISDSERVIREILSTPDIYALVYKETGEPIGCAGLTYGPTGRRFLAADEAEIGYWLGVPWWGKGLAGEAVNALLRRAFDELGMSRVFCGYYEGNERSRRVQEKCGFKWHHKDENTLCAPLNEYRTEHFTCITKQEERHA